jgi:hypothetical protein
MQYFIDITTLQKATIWSHLLPEGATRESAAFIFASVQESATSLVLTAQELMLVGNDGFRARHDDYIELSDESRISSIKKAHRTNTALVELHSHPFDNPWAPAFSLADMNGFGETVPHMWWRLPGRPYGAIVVAPNGFDSLVWLKSPRAPDRLTALRVDGETLLPTGMTLGVHHVSQM